MQKKNLEFVIEQAQHENQKSAIGKAVAESVEVGVVVPSILEKKLEAKGFKIVKDDAALADYGFASLKALKRVLVTDADGNLIAMGAAGDHAEALLHSTLGYFRENPVGDVEVPAGIATTPTNGNPESN